MANRIFSYENQDLPDPDPNMNIDQVRQHYSTFFPELANAESKQTKRGEDNLITFTKRVGTKGNIKTRVIVNSDANILSYVELSIESNSAADDASLLREAANYLEQHVDRTLLSLQLNHCKDDASETLLRLFFEG